MVRTVLVPSQAQTFTLKVFDLLTRKANPVTRQVQQHLSMEPCLPASMTLLQKTGIPLTGFLKVGMKMTNLQLNYRMSIFMKAPVMT